MQKKLIDILCCPLNKGALTLQIIKTEIKKYKEAEIEEITEGILTSSNGFIYPILHGVPRIYTNAFIEYGDFLSLHIADFENVKNNIKDKYSYIIADSAKKITKTKKSFSQEWKIFKYEGDTTWGFTKDVRKKRFLEEIGFSADELKGKTILDVGCGNGVLTSAVSEYGMMAIGIDVSNSIERAFINNDNHDTHYIQCDLQNPPFREEFFDIVYSTGVIHHTNNTELSFSCITPLVKPKGRLYVWLYRPEKDLRHNIIINVRKVTNKLPIWLQYFLYFTFLVPWGMLKERFRGRKITWREQLINYFDVLSCEFRYEHTPEEVSVWYIKRSFGNLKVTITEYLGFGMFGDRLN